MAWANGERQSARMLELHTMLPAYGLPTFTPFGLKLIAYMRLARLPFRLVVEHVPGRGPKGKFPWLVDGDTVVADSGFIVDYLVDRYGVDLDASLSPVERAHAHSLRRMLEESLCFSISYTRWVDDHVFDSAIEVILSSLSRPVRSMVRPLVRRRILRDLRGQGIGRHAPNEVAALGGADLHALSVQLGDRTYVMGERPTYVDASACAFLSVILAAPFDTSLKRIASALPNLIAYTQRMQRLCFDEPAAALPDGLGPDARSEAC